MSFKLSPKPSEITATDATSTQDEWVEIIEPNSKTKIYANLQSGICAKSPPEGVAVLTTDDFSDHWWELYDKKTGKYYYYNPEQQITVWTKPIAKNSGESKRVLIIPVSKLKTSRKFSTNEHQNEKCDASTQTIASNLISTGTQTINGTALDEMLSDKLKLSQETNDESLRSNSLTHSNSVSKSTGNQTKLNANHRQLSDFTGRYRNPYLSSYQRQTTNTTDYPRTSPRDQADHHNPSQFGPANRNNVTDLDAQLVKEKSYFAPTSAFHKNRRSMQMPAPVNSYLGGRRDDSKSSTSTFKTTAPTNDKRTDQTVAKTSDKSTVQDQPQQMVTNNLSHYLVREARAMGIALISDDEVEDDDQDSDEEGNFDDDEDTDLRDDLSSHRDRMNDLNASQDLGEESSEGWKSVSEQESPNGPRSQSARAESSSHGQMIPKSPLLCETSKRIFAQDELADDRGNPSASMSQQLDHRKLVQNFKKSRQTSALGFNDSLGRSYKLDANQAVQKIKTVADSYFKQGDKEKLTEKHLRQLSALSTLPRPNKETKEKSHLINGEIVDADYDVVEENCGYYSDSDRLQASLATSDGNTTGKSTISSMTKQTDEPASPSSYFDRHQSTRGSTFSVESFARENLTRHPRGGLLFNRKVKWSRMISWTKNSIKQPMISSVSSDLNSESITSFKLIQQFMGDRKITIGKKYRQILAQAGVKEEAYGSRKTLGRTTSLNVSNNTNSLPPATGSATNASHIPDRLRDELAHELCVKGCVKTPLRDEIFVQLARQLTENPCPESVSWGLILMSILLSYFSPSSKFAPFLLAFLQSHSHSMARDVCLPRLEKRLRQSGSTYCRKPADGQEISIVRLSITKWPQYCGVFGESLERIMSLQACSPYLKTLRLPWILTTLGEKLEETGGFETEGIFRCAADHDLLAQLRLEIDCVDFRKITDAKQVKSLLLNVQDPHVIAGLLKLFFRQLCEPVFPSMIYDICLASCQDSQMACRVFNEQLSNLNKDVVAYLIRLLQLLAQSDRVAETKMDTSNLSMVWAPNLLRAPELEPAKMVLDSRNGSKWSIANADEPPSANTSNTTSTTPSQSMIFEHARQEMQFIKALIGHLDTSFIKDVL